MLIVCPSCATSYMLDRSSLGPAGRMVRCARCKTAWFAGDDKPKADPAANYAENVIAEAEGRSPPPPTPMPPVRDDFVVDDTPIEPGAPRPHIMPPPEPAPIEAAAAADALPVSDAPSLIPPNTHEPLPPLRASEFTDEPDHGFAARRERLQAKRKSKRRSSKWTAIILVLFGFNVALIGARNEVVRFMPQTASLFAAVGMPVNLRQLSFEDVKVSREENDGVAVLVVEGNIVSRAGKAVEVPRMRFAVRNVGGQEIYSWTAAPVRTVLGPGESQSFRSRLAAPPADSSDVVVRFVSARDGVPGAK